jgi:transcriptional regulator with XRE-family HTH domain
MGQRALGLLLEHLREQRGFSLRDLSDLSKVDHAYIYRLEKGDKESPSDEVLSKLIRPLKAEKRDADMLRYLAAHSETDPELVKHVLSDKTVTFGEFTAAAGAAFRGTARPDYPKLIERVRRILGEDNGTR